MTFTWTGTTVSPSPDNIKNDRHRNLILEAEIHHQSLAALGEGTPLQPTTRPPEKVAARLASIMFEIERDGRKLEKSDVVATLNDREFVGSREFSWGWLVFFKEVAFKSLLKAYRDQRLACATTCD